MHVAIVRFVKVSFSSLVASLSQAAVNAPENADADAEAIVQITEERYVSTTQRNATQRNATQRK